MPTFKAGSSPLLIIRLTVSRCRFKNSATSRTFIASCLVFLSVFISRVESCKTTRFKQGKGDRLTLNYVWDLWLDSSFHRGAALSDSVAAMIRTFWTSGSSEWIFRDTSRA